MRTLPALATICLVASCRIGWASPPQEGKDSSADARSSEAVAVASATSSAPLNNARILKVRPDYQTVRDALLPVAPKTAAQKWHLGLREAVDPFKSLRSLASYALIGRRSNGDADDDSIPKWTQG